MIFNILKSLGITAAVSLVLGGLIYYLLGYPLLKSIVSVGAAQIIFFYIYNSITQLILSIRFEQEQTQQAEYFSKQGVDVTCAHCSNANFIPISMSEVNEFECQVCGKQNSVYVDITVAQKTDIVDKQSVTINSFNKQKQDAEQQLEREE